MVGVIRVSAAVPLGSRENLVLDRRRIADAVNGVTTRSDSGRKRLAVRVSARKSAQVSADWRPVPDDVPGGPYWYGYSAGKWEGDTFFFFNDTPTTDIYTLSLHDALPIFALRRRLRRSKWRAICRHLGELAPAEGKDRKSTRLNSSHRTISYAVFCLK